MSDQIASRARWTINSLRARNVQLLKLKSYTETDESDIEHVLNTAGEIAGELEKGGGGSLELEYYEEAGAQEVDWQRLKDEREYFSLTKQIVGGRRVQYANCRVANISAPGDDQGSHMITIKVIWRSRKAL